MSSLTVKHTADAVVIGGGVMGCSILYNLAAAGMKNLVLLERDALGSGSTGKSMAVCRMHYSNPVTARMAWESLHVYRSFEEIVGGPSGFVNTGYLLAVGPEDKAPMEANVSMQSDLGINTSVVSREDAAEIAPMLDVTDAAGLAYEPESGYADPYLVTTSYARQADEMGAAIEMGALVTGIEVAGGAVRAVVTLGGSIETPLAVVAMGPWAHGTLVDLGVNLPLSTVRHQVIGYRRPEELIPSHPVVGDISLRFSFRPDSGGLTLVGTRENEAAADSYDQTVDMDAVDETFSKLVHRMPDMSRGFFRGGWSGLFTVSPDWHPVLDRIEAVDGLFCAVGFSGHGFKLAPMVGVTMAELILKGRAETIDISPLRLSRFREGATLRSRYLYNVLA